MPQSSGRVSGELLMSEFHFYPLTKRFALVTVFAALTAISSAAFADPVHDKGGAIGEPGKPSAVTRTINLTMIDNEFEPKSLSFTEGETIRFIVVNKGEFVHEFNIGTPKMHAGHQEEMMLMAERGILEADRINRDRMGMKMGDGKPMMHEEPNSVLLEPGESAEIVWTFGAQKGLEFACNVPGHYEAGMVGKFEMQSRTRRTGS